MYEYSSFCLNGGGDLCLSVCLSLSMSFCLSHSVCLSLSLPVSSLSVYPLSLAPVRP